jgi:hypothetical protein
MKNAATRTVFAYWDALRAERVAPERSEIDPGAIRHVLADTFMIEVDPLAGHPFRLAGTRLGALFGRELKGSAFTSLWLSDGPDNGGAALVDTVGLEMSGVVAGLIGTTRHGEEVSLELLLLPLRHRGATHARMLGVLSPGVVPSWLGLEAVAALSVRSLRVIAARRQPEQPFGLTTVPPPTSAERRAHFVVYEGGK